MSTNPNIRNNFITLEKEDLKIKRFFFNAIKDSKQLSNFKSDRNKINHILRGISFLNGNSNNYQEYDKNLKLLKTIEHYNISDFVNELEMNDKFQKLFFGENENVVIIKNDDSEYGSNNRILSTLISKNISLSRKICDFSEINTLDRNSHVIYIDDFVGTGKTATELLIGDFSKKTIIAYYILEPTKAKLLVEGFDVINFHFAETVDNNTFEYYKGLTDEPYKQYGDYNLNTMISESYNSPNNNFPWLFYFKNRIWRNFLDARNSVRFFGGSGNNEIKKLNEAKYLTRIYSNICETKLREELSSLGFKTKEDRRKLFNFVLEKYDLDGKSDSPTEGPSQESMAEFYIYNELVIIFRSFQENIIISDN